MSAGTAWQLIAGCTMVTLAIKAVGPLALGGRDLPPWFAGVVALMAPALLSALVVSSALADGDHLAVGADTAGVAAAGLIVWRGGSVILAVTAAAAVAATLRAVA